MSDSMLTLCPWIVFNDFCLEWFTSLKSPIHYHWIITSLNFHPKNWSGIVGEKQTKEMFVGAQNSIHGMRTVQVQTQNWKGKLFRHFNGKFLKLALIRMLFFGAIVLEQHTIMYVYYGLEGVNIELEKQQDNWLLAEVEVFFQSYWPTRDHIGRLSEYCARAHTLAATCPCMQTRAS